LRRKVLEVRRDVGKRKLKEMRREKWAGRNLM
jgi:hypothetical protein